MKTLIVKLRMGGAMHHRIADEAVAQVAYDVIREAISKHKEFSNDETKTVEIALVQGVASYKVAEVAGVILDGVWAADQPDYMEQVTRTAEQRAYEEKALRAAYAAAELPWPPTKVE